MKEVRCEGYTKPGAFQFGPRVWTQCSNNAIIMITVKQEEEKTFPACNKCWKDAIERKMKIIRVEPIISTEDKP